VVLVVVSVVNTVSAVDLLFSEELGLLLEITEESLKEVVNAYAARGITCSRIGRSFHSTLTSNTV